MKVRQL
jgi:hypothetical protein